LGEKKKEQRRFESEREKRKFIDSVQQIVHQKLKGNIHEDPRHIIA
jgi:hypothetical protein